jgi:hypothetical protein
MQLKRIIPSAILFAVCAVSEGSMEDFLFTVRRDGREVGSGFLLKDEAGVWMTSNCHVVQKGDEIKFIGMVDDTRVFALPNQIEVASNRDAIRFLTGETDGLTLSSVSTFDETVFAYGNSDGLGVITRSEGKVVGKGRGQIEITCEIIPGNSGGPVVNTRNEVIGIATFGVTVPGVKIAAELSGTVSAAERERLIEKIKDRHGTRYTETRRFAVPVHDAGWQTVGLDLFMEEARRYEEAADRSSRMNAAVEAVFRCRAISQKDEDLFPRGWVRNYNQDLNEYGYYDSESGRYFLRSGRQESFDRAFGRWIQNLSETAAGLAKEIREQAEDLKVLYFQSEAETRADSLERRSRALMDIARKYGR